MFPTQNQTKMQIWKRNCKNLILWILFPYCSMRTSLYLVLNFMIPLSSEFQFKKFIELWSFCLATIRPKNLTLFAGGSRRTFAHDGGRQFCYVSNYIPQMAVFIQCSADAHSFVKLRIYDQKRDMYNGCIHFCMEYIRYTHVTKLT